MTNTVLEIDYGTDPAGKPGHEWTQWWNATASTTQWDPLGYFRYSVNTSREYVAYPFSSQYSTSESPRIYADVEMVGDLTGSRHLGLFLNATNRQYEGIRFIHSGDSWSISQIKNNADSTSWTTGVLLASVAEGSVVNGVTVPTFRLGERRQLALELEIKVVEGARFIKATGFVNGSKIAEGTLILPSEASPDMLWRPMIWATGTTLNIRSIKLDDNPSSYAYQTGKSLPLPIRRNTVDYTPRVGKSLVRMAPWMEYKLGWRAIGAKVRRAPSRYTKEGAPVGRGVITGTVKVKPGYFPLQRRVYLLERQSLTTFASVVSEPDGTFRFEQVITGLEYVAIAFDPITGHRAVIQDRVIPKKYPGIF